MAIELAVVEPWECPHPDIFCMECPEKDACEYAEEEKPYGPVTVIEPPPPEPEAPKPTFEESVKVVLICGSRSHHEWDLVTALCSKAVKRYPNARFICGGSKGVDAMARYCLQKTFNKKVETFEADWEGLGIRAGFTRNWEMLMVAQVVIALWDGESRGTANTIENGRRLGRRVHVWKIPAPPPE